MLLQNLSRRERVICLKLYQIKQQEGYRKLPPIHPQKPPETAQAFLLKGVANNRMKIFFSFAESFAFHRFATIGHFIEMPALPYQAHPVFHELYERHNKMTYRIVYLLCLLVFQTQLVQVASVRISCYLYDHGAFSL